MPIRTFVRFLVLVLLPTFGQPVAGAAQVFETVGTRALGMAGAFTAVADDASATYWNPAGLATGGPFSLLWDWSRVDVVPDADPTAAGGRERAGFFGLTTYPLGLSHYRLTHHGVRPLPPAGADPASPQEDHPDGWELNSLATRHTGVTLLQSLFEGLVIGATLKRVRGAAGRAERFAGGDVPSLLDEAESLDVQVSARTDVDLGIMASFRHARVGVLVRNLREPEFEMPDGRRLVLDRHARLGLAVVPVHALTIAVDADLTRQESATETRRALALGAEFWPVRRVGLRGGVRVNTAGERLPVGSAGASLALRPGTWVEAQVTRGAPSADRSWGIAVRLGY